MKRMVNHTLASFHNITIHSLNATTQNFSETNVQPSTPSHLFTTATVKTINNLRENRSFSYSNISLLSNSTFQGLADPFSQNTTTSFIKVQSQLEITLLLLIAFLAFIGNFLVCLPILMNPRIRTTINCFVLSLCFTQILTDCFVIPLYCFALGSAVYSYVVAFVVISYITNLLALTLDRYFAIKYPLRYRGIMWRGRCIRVILLCWMVSAFVHILPVLWYNSEHHKIIHKVYISTITVLFLLFPLCVVIFVYVNIFIEILSSSRKEKERRVTYRKSQYLGDGGSYSPTGSDVLSIGFGDDERKHSTASIISEGPSIMDGMTSSITSLVKTTNRKSRLQQTDLQVEVRSALIFFVIILMYGATWIPVLVMTIAGVLGRSHLIPKGMNTCSIYIMAGNTMLDPLIYGWYMKDIRKQLIKLFTSCYNKMLKRGYTKAARPDLIQS
ncbi:adenosine receptor A3-like [Clytia hemisphaerica]|uniref:adenosine receptor A3-like n=1 Tax=Clytia hemisphaerica TaxID=252671 RepID=UPI0034D607CD